MKKVMKRAWNRPIILARISINKTLGPINQNQRETTGGPKNYS